MRKTHILLLLIAVILELNVVAADPGSDEAQTIAKIEMLSGKVEQDESHKQTTPSPLRRWFTGLLP